MSGRRGPWRRLMARVQEITFRKPQTDTAPDSLTGLGLSSFLDPMKPPVDIPASELFLKLLEPLPTDVVDYPRLDDDGQPIDKIRIALLPFSKHREAKFKAHETLKKRKFSADDLRSEALQAVIGDETAKELLAEACFTVKDYSDNPDSPPHYGRVFASAADLDKLPADEVAVLFSSYLQVQNKYGPFVDDPDVEEWVKRLKEGGSEFPLLRLNSPDLVKLMYSTALQLFGVCRLLESHYSILPDTLKSDLEMFSVGTGYWSEPVERSTPTSGEDSLDLAAAVDLTRRTKAIDEVQTLIDRD